MLAAAADSSAIPAKLPLLRVRNQLQLYFMLLPPLYCNCSQTLLPRLLSAPSAPIVDVVRILWQQDKRCMLLALATSDTRRGGWLRVAFKNVGQREQKTGSNYRVHTPLRRFFFDGSCCMMMHAREGVRAFDVSVGMSFGPEPADIIGDDMSHHHHGH